MPRNALYAASVAAALMAALGCQQIPDAALARRADATSGSRHVNAAPRDIYTYLGMAPVAAPAATREPAEQLTAADRLTVISFNMQHKDEPRDLAVLAEYVFDLDRQPDFVLCQEVLFERRADERHESTAGVLAEELGYFARGTKRTSDREGVAIVSRWPFDYYDALHLKARTSALLAGFRRVSVMGEFIVPGLGRVRVVNVHFAYQPWENHVRRKQLDETLRWLAERDRVVPADVTILGGDFNMKPDRKEWALLDDASLTNDLDFLDVNTREPTRGRKGDPDARIDYIFVAAPRRVLADADEDVLFKEGLWRKDGSGRFWPSDHLPVLHEYAFARRSGGPFVAGAR